MKLLRKMAGIFKLIYFQLTLGAGVYAGMYIAQNYDVPKVDEPSKVYDKVLALFDDSKKAIEDAKKKIDK